VTADSIAGRLATVHAQIVTAATAAGRDPATVSLVAVSKTVAPERCAEALAAGQLVLGENYAQELRDKARLPSLTRARWHFIGPLQRNKVKYVVGVAELIHSVDSLPLVEELGAHAGKHQLVQRVLLHVNIGREPQKAGIAPEDLPSLVTATRARPELHLEGLMCLPPAADDPRPHFAHLAQLAADHGLSTLSMGMSADYVAAIAAGATLIRVGSAIFGARG